MVVITFCSRAYHCLLGLAKGVPSSCQSDNRLWHDNSCGSNRPDDSVYRYRVILLEGCTGDGHKRVDRERFGMFRQPVA